MSRLPQPANTQENNEKMADFSPLPAGDYPVVINKSEYKATKAKTGHYLLLQMVVMEGQYKGRLLFENLNLDNPNPVAVQIANKTLNSICDACELIGVEDSEELHGIPIMITVSLDPATATRPAGNSIKFYKKFDGELDIVENPEPGVTTVVSNNKTSTKNTKLPWE